VADTTAQLLDLERSAWEALAEGGDAAVQFYDDNLAAEVLMLLPGGMVIDDRRTVVDSMSGAGWDDYELADERVLEVTPDCAVVAYRARASRGETDYEALFNSTYRWEGDRWCLVLHQQTPIAGP
jgi:hypothetical protein